MGMGESRMSKLNRVSSSEDVMKDRQRKKKCKSLYFSKFLYYIENQILNI